MAAFLPMIEYTFPAPGAHFVSITKLEPAFWAAELSWAKFPFISAGNNVIVMVWVFVVVVVAFSDDVLSFFRGGWRRVWSVESSDDVCASTTVGGAVV